MKNITVSVPDEVYKAARIRAAHDDTSVSALVTEYLRGLVDDQEAKRAAAHQRLLDLRAKLEAEGRLLDARDNLTREELYEEMARQRFGHQ